MAVLLANLVACLALINIIHHQTEADRLLRSAVLNEGSSGLLNIDDHLLRVRFVAGTSDYVI